MDIWKFNIYANNVLCCTVLARDNPEVNPPVTASEFVQGYQQHPNSPPELFGLASNDEKEKFKFCEDEYARLIMYKPFHTNDGEL